MNEFLIILSILLVFSGVVLVKKFFGKEGLIGWIGIATILAEIGVTKQVNMFGLSLTLGNVLFASNFLATDILSECYGVKEAKKGVKFGIVSVIVFIIASQLMVAFIPNEIDYMQDSMKNMFSLIPRVCISSAVMYSIANYADVKLYDKLKKLTKGKYMWFRNNISTIICNGLENFFFTFFAFVGIFSMKEIIIIGLSTTLIEVLIAICDTPFLYLAKKIK